LRLNPDFAGRRRPAQIAMPATTLQEDATFTFRWD